MSKGYVVVKVVAFIDSTDACMALQRYLHMNCIPLDENFECSEALDVAKCKYLIAISPDKLKI